MIRRFLTAIAALVALLLLGATPTHAHGESRCDNGTTPIWVTAGHHGADPIWVASGGIFFGDFDAADVEKAVVTPRVLRWGGKQVKRWPTKTVWNERQWVFWNPADVRVPGSRARVRFNITFHTADGAVRDFCVAYAIA